MQAANFLNSEFSGRTLDEVRAGVIERLKHERSLYDQLLGLALRLASSSFENLDRPTAVYIDGASTLLEEVVQASGISAATLKALWRMVEEKQRLVAHAERIHRRPRPDGRDRRRAQRSGTAAVQPGRGDAISTAAAPARSASSAPTRMRYSKAITAVDIAAIAVASVLRDVN